MPGIDDVKDENVRTELAALRGRLSDLETRLAPVFSSLAEGIPNDKVWIPYQREGSLFSGVYLKLGDAEANIGLYPTYPRACSLTGIQLHTVVDSVFSTPARIEARVRDGGSGEILWGVRSAEFSSTGSIVWGSNQPPDADRFLRGEPGAVIELSFQNCTGSNCWATLELTAEEE